jgi:hypothetical protein
MVTFISLFLWLMTDVHLVQVSVDPSVASVEILLDGQSVGTATAPRWTVGCDFGETPRPHELVAVAYDDDGVETGRARQLVNLPRADAEVGIMIEGANPGAPEHVRVITESSERLEPLAISVIFDGRPLQSSGDGLFPLPVHDRGLVHIISAEAHFPGGISARSDVTFGGAYGSLVATDLTAVPIVSERRDRLDADQLQGLFRVRGKPVQVAAVEQPGARVYLVRDHAAWPSIRQTGFSIDRRLRLGRTELDSRNKAIQMATASVEPTPEQNRYHLIVPNPVRTRGLALFPIIGPFEMRRRWMPWLATHISSPEAGLPGQRLGEAVTVAAVRAAGGGAPRAVVLVLSKNPVDDSHYQPSAVQEYLRALRVPLVVWSTTGDGATGGWGEVAEISDLGSLQKASKSLLKELERQWIVWVEGRHLPSDIELDPEVQGIRLAG